jgi:DNA-binding HxlR family transcriptional regulator
MAALDLLGRRWALRILWELRDQPLGFRALQTACDDMSSSVLRDRLRELVEARILERGTDETYTLTPLGSELVTALTPLSEWSTRWADAIQ